MEQDAHVFEGVFFNVNVISLATLTSVSQLICWSSALMVSHDLTTTEVTSVIQPGAIGTSSPPLINSANGIITEVAAPVRPRTYLFNFPIHVCVCVCNRIWITFQMGPPLPPPLQLTRLPSQIMLMQHLGGRRWAAEAALPRLVNRWRVTQTQPVNTGEEQAAQVGLGEKARNGGSGSLLLGFLHASHLRSCTCLNYG